MPHSLHVQQALLLRVAVPRDCDISCTQGHAVLCDTRQCAAPDGCYMMMMVEQSWRLRVDVLITVKVD